MAVSISISIAQNSQSIANNTSNVTVKVTASWTGGSNNRVVNASGTPQANGWCKIDGTSYTFASTFNDNQTTTGSKVVFSKTVNVSHGGDGTKTLACSASYTTGVSSGTVTASANKTLTTIPRKSTLSVANGTLGTAQTLTVTRKSTSFTHTIVAKCGTASTTICTKSTTTSISFTPPLTWASQNTTGTSVSVTYTITTYNGSTNIGSNTYTKTCAIPSSVKPSCTITVTDPMGWADEDKYGAYIKGQSKFKIVVTPTTSYGSAIASYKTTADGLTYTSASFTTGTIKTSGTLTITATVTDKRGRTGTASVKVTVLDYALPVISSLAVRRCDADGTLNDQGESAQVTFDATISNPALDRMYNTGGYTLEYKKSAETTYTVVELIDYDDCFDATEATYIFSADSGSSYDVRLTAYDDFGKTSKTTSVSTAYTIMHWKANGYGMAIGKVAELDNVIDIGMQTRMLGGILHPVLEPETDLNDIRTPNTYVGANVSNYNYLTCPLTTGTFTLEVVGMGEDGQVKQRLTYCHKTASRVWERIYYSSSWGDWVCVSDFDGQLLWQGGFFMHDTQEITLAEPVSKQRSGIVLVFCRYSSSTVQNYHFSYHFVPKMMVAMHEGCGSIFQMGAVEGDYFAAKYLYISDQTIKGNSYNDDVITDAPNGIKYTNNATVLRYVIGV